MDMYEHTFLGQQSDFINGHEHTFVKDSKTISLTDRYIHLLQENTEIISAGQIYFHTYLLWITRQFSTGLYYKTFNKRKVILIHFRTVVPIIYEGYFCSGIFAYC